MAQQNLSYGVGGIRVGRQGGGGWGGGYRRGLASHVQVDQIRYGFITQCSHKCQQRYMLTTKSVGGVGVRGVRVRVGLSGNGGSVTQCSNM